MPGDETRRVYSTDGEHVEANRPAPVRRRTQRPSPGSSAPSAFPDDGFVRIRREKSGRGGKTVTAVHGLPGADTALDEVLKTLKRGCAAGGARNGRVLEIQGDHRDRVEAELTARGYRVKQAGG